MRAALPLLLCALIVGCDKSADSPTGPSSSAGPLFSRSGSGNDVFNRPSFVNRVRITGQFSGFSSNFFVYCGTDLLVNELLGTGWKTTSYAGTHAVSNCSQFEIKDSNGVSWTIAEVR